MNPTAAGTISAALKADTARFDASDLMPSAVGGGSFWTGMVDYTRGGPSSVDDVLAGKLVTNSPDDLRR